MESAVALPRFVLGWGRTRRGVLWVGFGIGLRGMWWGLGGWVYLLGRGEAGEVTTDEQVSFLL